MAVDTSKQVDLGGEDIIVRDILIASTPGGSTTDLSATNLTALSGVTAGTVTASKAVIVNSSARITSGLKGLTVDAGTATVAPLTLTAGTNLTTAAAGAIEYDGNAFYATAVASARQQVDSEQYIIATVDSSTYNNTGLDSTSAATALFSSTTNTALTAGAVTLSSGVTYAIEFNYMLTNTGTTSHTWNTLFGGTATFSSISNYSVSGNFISSAHVPGTGGVSGFLQSSLLSTSVAVTPASTTSSEFVNITGIGVITTSTAGTLIPQMIPSARPGASGTPAVVFKAGSFFRLWEMGNSTQVGNWS